MISWQTKLFFLGERESFLARGQRSIDGSMVYGCINDLD